MDTASPARLYCTLVGAVLVIAGIIGFFYSAGFDTGVNGVAADTDEVFGILAVNGWHNLVHIALGLLALAVAGRPPARAPTASAVGLLYLVLAIWGFADSDNVILGLIPLNDEDNFLHLILGLTGLAAGRGDAAPPSRARVHAARSAASRRSLSAVSRRPSGRRRRRISTSTSAPAAAPPTATAATGRTQLRGSRSACSSLSLSSSAQLASSAAACSAIPESVVSTRVASVLGRLDRLQRVGEQLLEPEVGRALSHRTAPPPSPSAPRAA